MLAVISLHARARKPKAGRARRSATADLSAEAFAIVENLADGHAKEEPKTYRILLGPRPLPEIYGARYHLTLQGNG